MVELSYSLRFSYFLRLGETASTATTTTEHVRACVLAILRGRGRCFAFTKNELHAAFSPQYPLRAL